MFNILFTDFMNTIIYTRVSTEDQTVEPQLLEAREFCQRMKWSVESEYSDVISGARAERPGLDAMVDRCSLGGVDAVVCVKLDRLGRSVLNVVGLIERLEKMGVAVVCCSQGIDTRADNPCGRMQYQIIAAVAEFERNLIRERTRAGLRFAKSKGVTLGRPSRKLLPEAERAAVVATWIMDGKPGGVRELARRLGGCSPTTAWKLASQSG